MYSVSDVPTDKKPHVRSLYTSSGTGDGQDGRALIYSECGMNLMKKGMN
jgi:hypothetical protein